MFFALFSPRRLPFALLGWLAMLFLPPQLTRAQEPLTAWTNQYIAPGGEQRNQGNIANATTVDAQGNVYVTGESYDSSTISSYATIKYAPDGKQLWAARYNAEVITRNFGTAHNFGTAIAVDPQGNVYVTGRSTVAIMSSAGTTLNHVYATIKYDANGLQQWLSTYGAYTLSGSIDGSLAADATPEAIAVDVNGNVYVTGEAVGGSSTGVGYATVKYSAGGSQQWAVRYENRVAGVTPRAYSIAADAQGNAYIAGNLGTIKYDAAFGIQQWAVGGGSAMTLDASANVYVTGGATTTRYDTTGRQIWSAQYTSSVGNSGLNTTAIALDAQGDVYVAGGPPTLNGNQTINYTTIKYAAGGSQLWTAPYYVNLSSYRDTPPCLLAVDTAGNATIVPIYYNASVVRYDTNGNQLWQVQPQSYPYLTSRSIAVDTQGNTVLAGIEDSYGGGYDNYYYTTAKIPATASTTDVTGQLNITRSGFSRLRTITPYTGTLPVNVYVQTVTVRYTGNNTMLYLIDLVLDGLNPNITLVNRTGVTTSALPLNSPYIGGHGPYYIYGGGSLTFTLMFLNPANTAITYTPRVVTH